MIPFDAKIAKTALTTIDLVVKMSEGMGGRLTTNQIKQIRAEMHKKYYNNKVELLEVSE